MEFGLFVLLIVGVLLLVSFRCVMLLRIFGVLFVMKVIIGCCGDCVLIIRLNDVV